MVKEYCLAIDIGASSGRHIVKEIGSDQIVEVYRFQNEMDATEQGLVWDIDRLWTEVKTGIAVACQNHKNIVSLGIDTWGVDYVLLNEDTIVKPVFAYRNDRTKESIDFVHQKISFSRLYQISGIQFEPFNTIYQLYWDKLHQRLSENTNFLMLPEYFFFRLTGIKVHEYTEATTTGLINCITKDYDNEILSALDLPREMFGSPVQPGYTEKATLQIQKELGFMGQVTLVATHDTASAVESVDIGPDDIYISSGTWSLLGIKSKKPIQTEEALNAGFSHEGGIGYLRFQTNIPGLWIIQQLKKELKIDSYQEMIEAAMKSNLDLTFDVKDSRLMSPDSMVETVKTILKEQHFLGDFKIADLFNIVFHSLAKSYQIAILNLERITQRSFQNVVIFGGGANNQYLNHLIEKYTLKNVIPFPIEATAIGNLKIQEQAILSKR